MRLGPLLVTCALVALLGTGCSSDEDAPEPVAAADLPDNLCAAVPANVVARWNLSEADHGTVDANDLSKASCKMTGAVDDEPVQLDIAITSYGGADADAVRALADDDLADQCDVLQQSSSGRFEKAGTRCSTEARGAFTEISRSVASHGVVSVTMIHDGELAQLLPAEVVGLSGTVANSEPDALS